MKCRNCRKRKPNMHKSPERPKGSIRKAERMEMRRKKKLAMKKAHKLRVKPSGGKTISESVVSRIKLNVEFLG